MIFTITLNPSIDRTLCCEGLQSGSINTACVIKAAAGGKGINVSRAIHRLSGGSVALSIIGGETGRLIVSMLEAEGIEHKYVSFSQESRMCYGIIDKGSRAAPKKRETIINEVGPYIDKDCDTQFLRLFSQNISRGDIAAISGSAIQGIAPQFYGNLVNTAKDLGAAVMIDLKGDNLSHAIAAVPDIIKINRSEFEDYYGNARAPVIKNKPYELIDKGVRCVIITDGGGDVIGITKDKAWIFTPPKVEVVNAWGSGDCVAGGFLYGFSRDMSFENALRLGIACGSANTLRYGAGFFEIDDVNRLLDMVLIKEL